MSEDLLSDFGDFFGNTDGFPDTDNSFVPSAQLWASGPESAAAPGSPAASAATTSDQSRFQESIAPPPPAKSMQQLSALCVETLGPNLKCQLGNGTV